MRVLLVCAFFPPEVGSAAHLYFELGQALRKRGHEVLVLTGLPRYHVLDDPRRYRRHPLVVEDFHGLRVYRVLNLNIPWNVPWLRGLDQFFSAFSFGLGGLRLPPFEVALVYSPPLPLALSTYLLCRRRRVPVIMNVQDIFPQSAIDLGLLRQPLLIRFLRDLETFLYRRVSHIVVHSEGNRAYVISRGAAPERVTAIPNWVDTEALQPGPRDNRWRRDLGLENRFVVSFAGIMGYSQDLETVLEAARMLRNHPDIVFLLVGDGVEKPRLRKLAESYQLENVKFLPMQPKAEYLRLLQTSDLCLVTLRREVKTPVVPSKILSIMAAGRPILAALPLQGDAPRLIARARAGICVPAGEASLLAAEVLRFSQDGDLGEQMGRNGRRFAETQLSLARAASRLEEMFASLPVQSERPRENAPI